MSVKATDSILGPVRGNPVDAIAYALANGAKRFGEVTSYINECYRLGPLTQVDPAIAIAQSSHETDVWRSSWWRERLNPAGIGITGDPAQNAASKTFRSGTEAARAQVSHLLLYATGRIDRGGLSPDDDPRYDAYVAAYGEKPVATTIDALAGKWAVDPDYAAGIVRHGNAIFGPDIPDQTTDNVDLAEEQPPVALNVDIALVNRGFGALQDSTPPITIHNTGAGNSRQQERAFVANGGGDQGVAYHFAVDETGITQIMPLWQRGIHAGNVAGNLTSIAIEMCMNREPWSAIKENTAQLLAMLHTRDKRLDWSGAEGFTFSLDQTTEHRQWAGANPNCPQRLIATDGGYPALVKRAREIVAGTKPPKPPKAVPHPVGGEADGKGSTRVIDGTLWLWVNKMFFVEQDIQAYEYANLASRKGPKYKGGKNIRVAYLVSGDGDGGKPEMYGTTRLGWRLRMKDLVNA